MKNWGFSLIVIGALGFIYPLFGMRLKILSFLDKDQMYIASGIIIGIGLVLAVLSLFFNKKASPSNQNQSGNNDQQH